MFVTLSSLFAYSASAKTVKSKLPDGSTVVHHLTKPSGKGIYPAVIVLHTIGGMTKHVRNFSRNLSKKQFVTTAVEWQTGQAWPKDKVAAVYDHLSKLPYVDPNRIGMLGFSRGALEGAQMTVAWQNEGASRPIRALVSYYMGQGVTDPEPELPPILFLHGDRDIETVAEQVVGACEKLKQMGNVCEAKIYKQTRHAFTHRTRRYRGYNAKVSADAYKRSVTFLNKYLKDKPIQ